MRRKTLSRAFITVTARTADLREGLRKERATVNKEKCNKKRNKLASDLLITQDRLEFNESVLQYIS